MNNKKTILVVDDVEMNRSIIKELFQDDYNILEAADGVIGLEVMRENSKIISAVLLDIAMPNLDGFGVLAEMKEAGLLNKMPVVVITTENDPKNENKALDLGAADLIARPFVASVIKRRVKNVVSSFSYKDFLERTTTDLSARLMVANQALVDTLVSISELRTNKTTNHTQHVRAFTRLMLKELNKSYPKDYKFSEDDIGLISDASALYDIGCITLPDHLLNRPFKKLNAKEQEQYRAHTFAGGKLIESFETIYSKDYIKYASEIALFHHERDDGNGYPKGLGGKDIPVWAEVVAMVSEFDSMANVRKECSPGKAIKLVSEGKCGKFASNLVVCFVRISAALNEISSETEQKSEK